MFRWQSRTIICAGVRSESGAPSHGVPDGLGRRFIPLACMVEVLAAPVGGGVGDFHIARAPPPAGALSRMAMSSQIIGSGAGPRHP